MRRFLNLAVTPPGGFAFKCPETGVTFRQLVFSTLVEKVRLFRIANGIPLPPGWQDILEDQICEQYPPNIWKYEDSAPATTPRTTRIGDVLSFLRFAGNWLKSGAELVPLEEAERRAAICVSCPFNTEIAGCTACSQLVEKVSSLLGGRSTKYEGSLHGCAICGCSLKAMPWYPLEALQKGMTDEMNAEAPEHCWKKKDTL